MTMKYHDINDFIKVLRVMHRKSITLEEIISCPDQLESDKAQQQDIDLLVNDIQAHAQQLIYG